LCCSFPTSRSLSHSPGPDVLDLVRCVVDAVEFIANLNAEVELFLQISLLNLDAGSSFISIGAVWLLPSTVKRTGICPQREWAIGAPSFLIWKNETSSKRYAAGSLVTSSQMTVKPGFRLYLFLLWFLVIGIPRLLTGSILLLEYLRTTAPAESNLDSCFAFGAFLQIVVDNLARWRVLAAITDCALRLMDWEELYAVAGCKVNILPVIWSVNWRSGETSSRIQKTGPCVAKTSSSFFHTRS